MLGLWCLFQAFKGLFVPLPTVAASVGRPSGVFAFCFFLPFQGWPWLLPGSGVCLCPSLPCCVPLLLLCLCVVCCRSSNAKRIPNPVPTKALPVVLVVLLGAVFSPSLCFLPPSPSLPLLMSFFGCLWLLPGGPFVGVGWSSLHLHVHPSSKFTRSVRAGVCVCVPSV